MRYESAERAPQLALVLTVHVVFWWICGWAIHSTIHHDMAELWAWGKEFQAGYFKHPPLSAWIAGAWFNLFPRQNWSFYLLSAVNAGIGLAGVFMIARLTLDHRAAWAALLLVMLTPFFNVYAFKLNANAVLLAVWPWTVYFFLRTLQTGRLVHATVFGALAGLAVLGKYYSAVLLSACFLASVSTPAARRLYLSPAPYVAVAAALIVLAPHALWVANHGFPTIEYAIDKTNSPRLAVLQRGLVATAQAIVLHMFALAALVFALGGERSNLTRAWRGFTRPENRVLVILTLGPLLITLLACAIGNVRISTQFMIPAFFLLPIAVLSTSRIIISDLQLVRLTKAAAMVMLAFASSALIMREVAASRFEQYGHAAIYEFSRRATQHWRHVTGTRLPIVTGDHQLAVLVAFYSPDRPSILTDFDRRKSPWISADALNRHGALVVCRGGAIACAARYPHLGGADQWSHLIVPAVGDSASTLSALVIAPQTATRPAVFDARLELR
jgi:4-amino-4-deoxy-L-arabinose transferase-like glycosyltransferase